MSISLGSLLLVLACSLAWAGVDTARKMLAGSIRPAPLIFLLTAASVPFYAVWVAWDGMPKVGPGYLAPACASLALNVWANLAFIAALRMAALSVTVPLLSLTPVFTALLAIPMLGERPSALQGFGIVLVVAGAFTLQWPQGKGWRFERGALLTVGVALAWSLAVPLDKLAVEQASAPFHATVLCAGVGLAALLVLLGQGRAGELVDVGRVRGAFVLALLASVVALALQLLAIQVVWVSLMETIKRGIGNVSALLMGRLLFGESVTPRKVMAIFLMALGVALVVR
ncbi:MAG TPA: DMT family transporter [Thermoanaerobaculia bacterium]|nr:DMT family transporter [Thermoanaerobaculia bacterium]